MAKQEILYYNVKEDFSLQGVSEGIRSIMEQAKCETQIITISETSTIVQCRNTVNGGFWRNITGNSKALSVSLTLNGLVLTIQVGNTQWGDKAAGYALAWFIFWPLAITASYGIYSQNQLKQQVLNYIQTAVI